MNQSLTLDLFEDKPEVVAYMLSFMYGKVRHTDIQDLDVASLVPIIAIAEKYVVDDLQQLGRGCLAKHLEPYPGGPMDVERLLEVIKATIACGAFRGLQNGSLWSLIRSVITANLDRLGEHEGFLAFLRESSVLQEMLIRMGMAKAEAEEMDDSEMDDSEEEYEEYDD